MPVDTILPWDKLNDDGFVRPGRGVVAVNGSSELLPGVEREADGGSVVDNGEASRITSGNTGSGEVSYAIYRLPLGGEQPGVDLLYIRADVANGSSWPASSIEVSTGGDSGRFTSMTLINGYPAIGFHWMHNTAAAYVRASDVNGDTWDASASIYDPRGNSGQYANLIQVNGQAAMSYFYFDGGDQWLRYARWY